MPGNKKILASLWNPSLTVVPDLKIFTAASVASFRFPWYASPKWQSPNILTCTLGVFGNSIAVLKYGGIIVHKHGTRIILGEAVAQTIPIGRTRLYQMIPWNEFALAHAVLRSGWVVKSELIMLYHVLNSDTILMFRSSLIPNCQPQRTLRWSTWVHKKSALWIWRKQKTPFLILRDMRYMDECSAAKLKVN